MSSETDDLVRKLNEEAVHWLEATHTVSGPTVGRLLVTAAQALQSARAQGMAEERERAKPQLRYARAPVGSPEQIYEAMRKSALYQIGDCILVWVNEGDFWLLSPTDLTQPQGQHHDE